MRAFFAIGILVVSVGCAGSGKTADDWRRADGSAVNLEQLQADQVRCMNRAGVASPGSRSPMQATRDDMIDCMRMRGWVQR
ncbi:MAG: hypothetical protein JRE38_03155 [Deltaproteobacteria bacterium]|jgi:hypothetical protein|nr:hypothetical protein [Deltaproteobacteria bacterium]MBW2577047.1 hypothetical protein [Deltaproteobacteria bacterium]